MHLWKIEKLVNQQQYVVLLPHFIFLRADSQAETTVFNATLTALNQQSWTWELSPVEAQGWGSSLSLFPIRWFRLKSLKIGTVQKMLQGCAYAVKHLVCAESCILCTYRRKVSIFLGERSLWGKEWRIEERKIHEKWMANNPGKMCAEWHESCTIWWQFRKTFITEMHSHSRANWQVIMIESYFSEFQPKCFHALMPTGKAPSAQHSINILPFSFLDKCVLDEQVLCFIICLIESKVFSHRFIDMFLDIFLLVLFCCGKYVNYNNASMPSVSVTDSFVSILHTYVWLWSGGLFP